MHLKDQCVFMDILAEMEYNIRKYVSLMYNHQKLRIVFSFL